MEDGNLTILYIKETCEYAACSVSKEHTEQQSNRATEHSTAHVTHRSAVLAAGRTSLLPIPLPGASLQQYPCGSDPIHRAIFCV